LFTVAATVQLFVPSPSLHTLNPFVLPLFPRHCLLQIIATINGKHEVDYEKYCPIAVVHQRYDSSSRMKERRNIGDESGNYRKQWILEPPGYFAAA
jgi:hypothetical protein